MWPKWQHNLKVLVVDIVNTGRRCRARALIRVFENVFSVLSSQIFRRVEIREKKFWRENRGEKMTRRQKWKRKSLPWPSLAILFLCLTQPASSKPANENYQISEPFNPTDLNANQPPSSSVTAPPNPVHVPENQGESEGGDVIDVILAVLEKAENPGPQNNYLKKILETIS